MVGRLLLVPAFVHMGGSVVRVAHIGDIPLVGIGDGELDSLEAIIGKLDMVFTISIISITSLALSVLRPDSCSHLRRRCLLVVVLGRGGLVGWLMVAMLGGVVGGSVNVIGQGQDGKNLHVVLVVISCFDQLTSDSEMRSPYIGVASYAMQSGLLMWSAAARALSPASLPSRTHVMHLPDMSRHLSPFHLSFLPA
jgi:hypothetical protein